MLSPRAHIACVSTALACQYFCLLWPPLSKYVRSATNEFWDEMSRSGAAATDVRENRSPRAHSNLNGRVPAPERVARIYASWRSYLRETHLTMFV